MKAIIQPGSSVRLTLVKVPMRMTLPLSPLHFALATREGIFGIGDGLDVRKDRFTIGGEMDAFLAAGEQGETKFLLEIFDGLADGALRILDGIGGFCESAVLDDFAKDVVFG